MKVEIEHTATLTTFVMNIDGQAHLIKELYTPHDGDTEVVHISKAYDYEVPPGPEWDRIEAIFQQNRTE